MGPECNPKCLGGGITEPAGGAGPQPQRSAGGRGEIKAGGGASLDVLGGRGPRVGVQPCRHLVLGHLASGTARGSISPVLSHRLRARLLQPSGATLGRATEA